MSYGHSTSLGEIIARAEGRIAFDAGVAKEECPYPAGSDEEYGWLRGWNQQRLGI